MADMSVSWGLDGSAAASGLDAIEASARRSGAATRGALETASRSIEKEMIGLNRIGPAVFGAIGTAAVLAGKSISDASKNSDALASKMEQIQRQSAKTWDSIGRDIGSLLDGPVMGLMGGLEETRVSIVDGLAGALRKLGQNTRFYNPFTGKASDPLLDPKDGGLDEVNEAYAFDRRMTIERKARAQIEDYQLNLTASRLEKEGSLVEAQELRNRATRQKFMQGLQGAGVTGAALDKAKTWIDNELESAMTSARLEQGMRGSKVKQRAMEDQQQRDRRLEDLTLERESMNIDTMRIEGKKKEADLAQLELDTRKKILEIERDQQLNAEQRAEQRDAVLNAYTAQAKALSEARDPLARNSVRSVMGGTLGGRALQAMVFSDGNQTNGTMNLMMKAEVDQVKLLSRIASAVEKRGGVVLGR